MLPILQGKVSMFYQAILGPPNVIAEPWLAQKSSAEQDRYNAAVKHWQERHGEPNPFMDVRVIMREFDLWSQPMPELRDRLARLENRIDAFKKYMLDGRFQKV